MTRNLACLLVLLVLASALLTVVAPASALDPCSLVEDLLKLPDEEARALFEGKMDENVPWEGSGVVREVQQKGRTARQVTLVVECANVDGFIYLSGVGKGLDDRKQGDKVSYKANCRQWKKNNYDDSEEQFISIGCSKPWVH